MTGELTGRCTCGAKIQRNGSTAKWRHQRPTPSGAPHDHVAVLAAEEAVTVFDTFSMDPPPSVLTAGARVRLVHTDDTVTKLRPGDEGTVRGFRLVGDDERLDVAWDSGSTLTMLLNEGDRVEVIR